MFQEFHPVQTKFVKYKTLKNITQMISRIGEKQIREL